MHSINYDLFFLKTKYNANINWILDVKWRSKQKKNSRKNIIIEIDLLMNKLCCLGRLSMITDDMFSEGNRFVVERNFSNYAVIIESKRLSLWCIVIRYIFSLSFVRMRKHEQWARTHACKHVYLHWSYL